MWGIPAHAQDEGGLEVDELELPDWVRSLQEHAQQRMNEEIRQTLALTPAVPADFLRYKVRPEHIERLCSRLLLSDDGKLIAQIFYKEYLQLRQYANESLNDLWKSYEFPRIGIPVGEYVPSEHFRQRFEFERERHKAMTEHRRQIEQLFEDIAVLARDRMDNDLHVLREHWQIDVLLNPPSAVNPYNDLGARINLLDVLDDLAKDDEAMRRWLDAGESAQAMIANYRLQLLNVALRSAELYPQMRIIRLRSGIGDDRAAAQLARLSDSLWRTYRALNGTFGASLAQLMTAELSVGHADRFTNAMRKASHPSTDRDDAADRVHAWLMQQMFVRESEDEELPARLDELIESHLLVRSSLQPRLREIAVELRQIQIRGTFAALREEQYRHLTRERSELHRRHRDLMQRTIDGFRALVPESHREEFESVFTTVWLDDMRYCHTQF